MIKRPLSTYSIVARDPENGQIGVAVQSHYFSVGTVSPWAEAGVGAIVTQGLPELTYGQLGLDMMRVGKSASSALRSLLATDSRIDYRQIAMVDRRGSAAAFTGELCIGEAGHKTGENYSCQANMMLNTNVWEAMGRAFEESKEKLPERLIASLEAAEREGGDIRGCQSAALIVVNCLSTGRIWEDRLIDIRVDDHIDPVKELKRLLRLKRAYTHNAVGDIFLSNSQLELALKEYEAAESMEPENMELSFWRAVALTNSNRLKEAMPLFEKVFSADPRWMLVIDRLVKSKLLTNNPVTLRTILTIGHAD